MGDKIQLFENQPIRIAWDEEKEEWFFSVVDVVGVLTDQPSARSASTYWAVLKKRLKKEGANQLLTNCKQLKLLSADGKRYSTMCEFYGKRLIYGTYVPHSKPVDEGVEQR